MELCKDLSQMTIAQQAEVNPLWPDYRRQILQSMKEQGFSASAIDARIQIAYNRMHGLPNSDELLKNADGDQAREGEWATDTTGKEFF